MTIYLRFPNQYSSYFISSLIIIIFPKYKITIPMFDKFFLKRRNYLNLNNYLNNRQFSENNQIVWLLQYSILSLPYILIENLKSNMPNVVV